jgi:hypothetical protein
MPLIADDMHRCILSAPARRFVLTAITGCSVDSDFAGVANAGRGAARRHLASAQIHNGSQDAVVGLSRHVQDLTGGGGFRLVIILERVDRPRVSMMNLEHEKHQLGAAAGRLSNGERATLAEIGERLGRKALPKVASVAKPGTILACYRKLTAQKFDGSKQRPSVGRPRIDAEVESLIVRLARENSGWGL